MASIPSLIPLVDAQFEKFFGPTMIGAFLSVMLYGMILVQAYHYFNLYRTDERWLKALVTLALILETILTVIHMHICFWYTVDNYYNPAAFLGNPIWSLSLLGIFTAGVTVTCQSFFMVRLWLVGPRYYTKAVVLIAATLLLGAFASSTVVTVQAFKGFGASVFRKYIVPIVIYNALASGADVMLTTTLIYVLHKSRTGFKRTDTLLNRLILYSVTTGFLTTTFNITSFVLVLADEITNTTWVGTIAIAAKLYTNSLLAALNSRKFTSGREDERDARRSEPFGTARADSLHFNHHRSNLATTTNDIELPRVATRFDALQMAEQGDVKIVPGPFSQASSEPPSDTVITESQ